MTNLYGRGRGLCEGEGPLKLKEDNRGNDKHIYDVILTGEVTKYVVSSLMVVPLRFSLGPSPCSVSISTKVKWSVTIDLVSIELEVTVVVSRGKRWSF